jgi:tetratricopeptide (TPR) repeat protein
MKLQGFWSQLDIHLSDIMNLFDHWDFGDPVASLERFRHVAREATNDADKALALTQVARALGLQDRFMEARAALAEADLLLPASGRERAQYWIELGRVMNSEHNPAAALSCFQQSLALATDAHDEYLSVDAAHMIAIVVAKEKQPECGEFALSLARNASDKRTRHWIGPISNNLGWTYMELGQYEDAIRCFRESLAYRLTQKEDTPIRLARYALGCALRASSCFDEAVRVLNEALAMGGSIGFIEEELAECLSSLGNTAQAKPLFRIAYDKLKANTDLGEREPERLSRLLERSL